ncbi:regulatory GntR family protein [Streptohalobacillus salinus]|uniref:Regulatory GntR family protein n=1 Tax=Streptohalobacillus salinus TaxID=621096 RepID=A0A2V3W1K2_9BACI|nr:GntR family transcriptional regulator [Streptohalobacillus salinus]PXW88147.1 regulatory GntR family protein [Streptohalobacillus salinus]
MTTKQNKAYENVLEKIKNYIERDHLKPGDRLPSEREMAEELQVSRSTIREGLRAIELLGMIETRRGEGTFLRPYQSYQTLSLLSTFIFQDPATKKDLAHTLSLIEQAILFEGATHYQQSITAEWSGHQVNYWKKRGYKQTFQVIIKHINNELLAKIWYLLYAFRLTLNEDNKESEVKQLFERFDQISVTVKNLSSKEDM